MKSTPPQVQREKCSPGCGICVEVCPSFVFELKEGKAWVARGEWCIGCGHCGAVCPQGAILHEATDYEKEARSPVTEEDILLLLRSRRSVRLYEERPISRDHLEKVIDAGRYAPTGTNSQNVRYILLVSPQEIERLRSMSIAFYEKVFKRVRSPLGSLFLRLLAPKRLLEHLKETLPKVEYAKGLLQEGRDPLLYDARAVLILHAEAWDTCSPFNCAVALYHCSLMAHTLGVGCCFNWYLVNAINHDRKIKRWLNIPRGDRCFGAMTMGYPRRRFLRLVKRASPPVRWR